jgi:hypothetical protein
MQISSSIKEPQHCEEYWWRYFDLVDKNQELIKAQKISPEKANQVKKEIADIVAEMTRHLNCCEYCLAWLRSFEISS